MSGLNLGPATTTTFLPRTMKTMDSSEKNVFCHVTFVIDSSMISNHLQYCSILSRVARFLFSVKIK